MLSNRRREVEGTVAHDALEEHFWLPRDADATRMLRTFENGRNRPDASLEGWSIVRPWSLGVVFLGMAWAKPCNVGQ
ncbi:hypothetical protein PQR57_39480 [Paraburkholderia dipogonis]|uniref:Uncharacterized protein n=1 Tax=Paraburkholderia dipogonis TaxID=1211383 RepID=A0ABW9B3U9_9BURK